MLSFLHNFVKRENLGFPSKDLVLQEAKKLGISYRRARRLLKRALWREAKI